MSILVRTAVLAVLFILGGCAHTTGGAAPSTIPLTAGSYHEIGPVRGQDCLYSVLGLLPVTSGNQTKDAIADAMAQAPGASALVNVSADTYFQYFILFSRTCTQVHGVAVAPK